MVVIIQYPGLLERSLQVAAEVAAQGRAGVAAVDPQRDAVVELFDDAVADPYTAGARRDGFFAGVPFLMKDIGGEEAGRPLCAGLKAAKQAGHRADRDSHFAERIRGAGFVSLGRTNTPELALLPTTEPEAFGPTRNPWNTDHSAGGSSGGAASAVAAGTLDTGAAAAAAESAATSRTLPRPAEPVAERAGP